MKKSKQFLLVSYLIHNQVKNKHKDTSYKYLIFSMCIIFLYA